MPTSVCVQIYRERRTSMPGAVVRGPTFAATVVSHRGERQGRRARHARCRWRSPTPLATPWCVKKGTMPSAIRLVRASGLEGPRLVQRWVGKSMHALQRLFSGCSKSVSAIPPVPLPWKPSCLTHPRGDADCERDAPCLRCKAGHRSRQ